MTLDDELTTLMYAASDEAPPPRVDLGRAVRDGRRRRVVHALVPSTAVALLLISVVAGVAAVAAHPRAVLSPAAPPAAPTSFDPMVVRIETGWNPDNLPELAPKTSTIQQVIEYSDGAGKGFEVSIDAAGQVPWPLSGTAPKGYRLLSIVDVPAVHGRPAKRFSFDAGSGHIVGLIWQWADGAWAVAQVRTGYVGQQEQVERLLAENLRTDVSRTVRLPFRVTAPLPAGLRLFITTGQGQGSDPYGLRAEMGFGPASPQAVLVDLTVVPAASGTTDPEPNTTLGGHPAYLSWKPDGGRIVVYGADGFDVTLTMVPEAGLLTQDQAVALALSVRRT